MIQLRIDGIETEYDLAGTMFQKEPFPGGHSYSLDIEVDPELFDFLGPNYDYDPSNEDIASSVLSRLTRMLRGKSKRDCRYYLNSIQTLSVSEKFRLRLTGVCSDVI
jgi:hypothetical protein